MVTRCVSILTQINTQRRESLDLDYKTPKIKGNYKGGGGGPKIFQSSKQVSSSETAGRVGEENVRAGVSAGIVSPGAAAAAAVAVAVAAAPAPPGVMQGWLKKEGHQFKTIKRRYFVLQEGELKYYEKPLPVAPFGEKIKGTFPLKDGSVEFGVGDGKALGKDGNKRLFVQASVSFVCFTLPDPHFISVSLVRVMI
jgi:hypothetical protein